ncbi:MAG: tetratricopeptide repeat protein [Myxococcales bacterium]
MPRSSRRRPRRPTRPPPAASRFESLQKSLSARFDAENQRRLGDLLLEEHFSLETPPANAPQAQAAAQAYRAVLATTPAYPKTDEVLLALGEALRQAGDAKEAMATWRRLVKDLPKSKSVGDAWLGIARLIHEGSREASRLTEAQEALEKALKLKTTEPAAAHALLAKVDSDLGEYAAALEHLGATVDLAEKDDPESAQEARKEFVALYSRAGDPAKAIAEVKKVGGAQHSWDMLAELANAYHELGRTADSTRLFQQLMKERPSSPDVPLFRCRLVGYLMRGTDKKAILEAVRELAASIKKVEAEGDFTREADRKSIAEARKKAEGMLHTLSATWHEAAQASGNSADVMDAEQMCTLYLKLFPEDPPADLRRCSEGY